MRCLRFFLLFPRLLLGLRQVIDWMMYVHCCLDDEAWENGFKQMVSEYGLETLAITLTRLCSEWLGLPDRFTWYRQADLRTAEELLDAVLSHGNFGRKMVTGQRVERVGRMIQETGFFRFLQDRGMAWWKPAKQYSILTPFAWIYTLCYYARKGAGLVFKPCRTIDDFNNGKRLSELYRKLGLL